MGFYLNKVTQLHFSININMSKPILAYWDIRGLAEPVRLCLEYGGVEYDEKKYACGEAPDYDRTCWFGEKFSLGLDFPNLPYFIDGDLKFTESWAILRYAAHKAGVVLTDSKQQAIADMVAGVVNDFRMSFVMMCYGFGGVSKEKFLESLPKHLETFNEFLNGKKWAAGDNLSY